MNISGDTPGVDYVEYFTKQLPKDLAAMAARSAKLDEDSAALDARIKAFQQKVANLSV